jgi:hypothetical protein
VVGAGDPDGVATAHPLAADDDVLDGVVERVADVQRAGDVRGRDDDAERLARVVGLGVEEARASQSAYRSASTADGSYAFGSS